METSAEGLLSAREATKSTLREIAIADEPEPWAAAGFTVEARALALGDCSVTLGGSSSGSRITHLGLGGLTPGNADGLELVVAPAPTGAPPVHSNRAVAVDHVVAMSPRLDRTVAALEAAGLELRRIREEPTPAGAPRQAFFHLGTAVLEVVQEPVEAVERGGGPDRAARFWGLAFVCEDLDEAAALLGDRAAPIRDAIQPGRRIMPLRRDAGLCLAVAFMSPRPRG